MKQLNFNAILLSILLSSFLISCNTGSVGGTWVSNKGKGLNISGQSFDALLAINRNEMLLLGNDDLYDSSDYMSGSAIICHTIDGGLTWDKKYFGKCENWAVKKNGTLIYAAKVERTGAGDNHKTVFFKSLNNGLDWDSIGEIDEYVIDFFLNPGSDGVILATGGPNGPHFFKVSNNFNVISNIPISEFAEPIIFNDNIVFFMPNKEGKTAVNNRFAKYNFEKDSLYSYNLPEGFNGWKIAESTSNGIWIAGITDKQARLYRQMPLGDLELIRGFAPGKDFYPDDIFTVGSNIIVVCAKAGPLIASYSIFVSNDNGVSWMQDSPSSMIKFGAHDFILDPVTNQLFAAAYSLNGEISVRHQK